MWSAKRTHKYPKFSKQADRLIVQNFGVFRASPGPLSNEVLTVSPSVLVLKASRIQITRKPRGLRHSSRVPWHSFLRKVSNETVIRFHASDFTTVHKIPSENGLNVLMLSSVRTFCRRNIYCHLFGQFPQMLLYMSRLLFLQNITVLQTVVPKAVLSSHGQKQRVVIRA